MRLVYLSPVPLGSFEQRPHHFVKWFHDRFNADVLWIEPYPSRLPKLQDFQRLVSPSRENLGPTWASDKWITTLKVPFLPIEPLAWGRALNRWLWRDTIERIEDFVEVGTWIVAAKPSALALELIRYFPACEMAFDILDNVPAFASGRSRHWLASAERQLAYEADWIVTSSTPLYEKFAGQWPAKTRLVRNGLSPVTGLASRSVRHCAGQNVIFGYVGAIASWFDWGAVIELALANPHARIRLVGPCEHAPPGLPSNIELLPAIPHEQVYPVMSEFSVGLIPFQITSLTEYVDPVKYYEYRALGLPVLSTRFGEMRLRGKDDGVLFFEDSPNLQMLTELSVSDLETASLGKFHQASSWSRRFDQLDIFNFDQEIGAAIPTEPASTARSAGG